jgi:ribonuclease HI
MSNTFYTDGSCLGNPGRGGWAVVYRGDAVYEELGGAELTTTNNRMELMAVIQALTFAGERGLAEPVIYTDSQYVQKGITEWMRRWIANGWKTAAKQPVKNRDLWERLAALNNSSVRWQWVKGHAGHPENERADELAVQQAKGLAGV